MKLNQNQNRFLSDFNVGLRKKYFQKRTAENRLLVSSGKKRCNICHEIKSLSEFHKSKTRYGGVSDECKICVLLRSKRRYEKTRFGPERLNMLKRHAKKVSVPFNITSLDLENLWTQQNGLCYYTKIPMQFINGSYNTVSVDRINPLKGYTLDNLCLCCDIVNYMKSDLSYERLLFVCSAVVKNALPITDDLKQGYQELVHHRKQSASSRKQQKK